MLKRVVIFTSEFPPGPGGIGNQAYSLALHLTLKGYEVLVLSDFRDIENKKDIEWDKTQPFPIMRVNNKTPRFLTYFERLIKLNRILASFKPDVIISSGKFPLLFAPFIVNMKKKRPLSLIVVHGSELYGKGIERVWIIRSLSLFDRIIAVSDYTGRILKKHLGYTGKVEVIHNGILAERFKDASLCKSFSLEGKPVLLTVGSISKRKGQHNVVNALSTIAKKFPNVMYHVVGLTRDDKVLQREIQKNSIQRKVVIHGPIDERMLPCFYLSTDIFVMLSETTKEGDTEGFGIAILEANYFGKPAIGSKGCGIEDAIRDGITGRIVDPHNPQEIQSVLTDILKNYRVYSENARRWAQEHVWSKVIEKYIRLMETLL